MMPLSDQFVQDLHLDFYGVTEVHVLLLLFGFGFIQAFSRFLVPPVVYEISPCHLLSPTLVSSLRDTNTLSNERSPFKHCAFQLPFTFYR